MFSKLYTQTISDLAKCYNTHADKFSSTRKKHWPEMERVIDRVKKREEDQEIKKTIFELGCGDGRLYSHLIEQKTKIDKYTGVDISSELIQKAKKNHPDDNNIRRVIDDMIGYLQSCDNESVDIIVCMASFQHIPDKESRNKLLQEIYRVMRYGGKFVSIDRSWSYWMLRTHRKAFLKSLWKYIISLWWRERSNLLIPFRSNNKNKIEEKNLRLYHIFMRSELKNILTEQWFVIEDMIYSSQSGEFHHKRQQARNICTCVRKDIFVNSDRDTKVIENLISDK